MTNATIWLGDLADPMNGRPVLQDEDCAVAVEGDATDEVVIHATMPGDRNALLSLSMTRTNAALVATQLAALSADEARMADRDTPDLTDPLSWIRDVRADERRKVIAELTNERAVFAGALALASEIDEQHVFNDVPGGRPPGDPIAAISYLRSSGGVLEAAASSSVREGGDVPTFVLRADDPGAYECLEQFVGRIGIGPAGTVTAEREDELIAALKAFHAWQEVHDAV